MPATNLVTLSEAGNAHDPITVNCEQMGPINWLPAKPKVVTVDLPGALGLTQYVGQDPYEVDIPVRLDGFPSIGVENRIRALESLAEVQPGQDEPPGVAIGGAVPNPHPHLVWRVLSFDDPAGLLFLPDGTTRCRYETTVHLIQKVTDRTLAQTLTARSKTSGLIVRTWIVKVGEDSLTDVARHAYHDSTRAADIATANGLHLGVKLKPQQTLKLPS